MDQITLDLSAIPEAREGDEVVLIGKQGADEITADELARLAGTISYEIMCGLTSRVPRFYFREGQLVASRDLLGIAPGGDQ
jgi:alanine racemase